MGESVYFSYAVSWSGLFLFKRLPLAGNERHFLMLRFASCQLRLLCQIALVAALEQIAPRVAACHPDLRQEILVAIAVEDELGLLLYFTGPIRPGHASVAITTTIRALDH